ncbi:unnamed protein product [Closterium sp. NIES-64]|nr:unnamed protein product [Closterium sp. NIES-64]CAI5982359.1 unnamed protein product [Closterium sp. NIES-65]
MKFLKDLLSPEPASPEPASPEPASPNPVSTEAASPEPASPKPPSHGPGSHDTFLPKAETKISADSAETPPLQSPSTSLPSAAPIPMRGKLRKQSSIQAPQRHQKKQPSIQALAPQGDCERSGGGEEGEMRGGRRGERRGERRSERRGRRGEGLGGRGVGDGEIGGVMECRGGDEEGDEGRDGEGDEGRDGEGDEGRDGEGDEGRDGEGDEGRDGEGDEGRDGEGDEGRDGEVAVEVMGAFYDDLSDEGWVSEAACNEDSSSDYSGGAVSGISEEGEGGSEDSAFELGKLGKRRRARATHRNSVTSKKRRQMKATKRNKRDGSIPRAPAPGSDISGGNSPGGNIPGGNSPGNDSPGGAFTQSVARHCSRTDGKGWVCMRIPRLGFSLCDHHIGKAAKLVAKKREEKLVAAAGDIEEGEEDGEGCDGGKKGEMQKGGMKERKVDSSHSYAMGREMRRVRRVRHKKSKG